MTKPIKNSKSKPVEGVLLDVPLMESPPPVEDLWSVSKLHEHTRVDRRTIEKRLLDAKIQPARTIPERNGHSSHLYRGPEAFRAILATDARPESLVDAERRLLLANASIKERQDKREGGEIIFANDAEKVWEKIIALAWAKLDRIPNNLQSRFNLNAVQLRGLREEIDEVKSEFSKEIIYAADELDEEDNHEDTKAPSE